MKTHHLGAIKMASSILQEGRSPEVRMLASSSSAVICGDVGFGLMLVRSRETTAVGG
jgi:hypothetical protein